MKFNFPAFKKIGLKNFLLIALIAILLINIAVILQNKSIVAKKKMIADEMARPANISITIIKDSSCADCADLTNYIDTIKAQNVKVVKEETLEATSGNAQNVIKKLEIKKLPTFIVNGEVGKSDNLKNLLLSFGQIDKNTFKFTGFAAPYLDLTSNQIKGQVNLTLISDKSCAECQNAQIYKQILARFGLSKFSSEADLDRSDAEAKKLIQKYNIAALPTFVLTGEVSEYQNLNNSWSQVGTIGKDGSFVFRELKVTNLTYSNLKTGKVIKPAAANPTTAPSPSPKPK